MSVICPYQALAESPCCFAAFNDDFGGGARFTIQQSRSVFSKFTRSEIDKISASSQTAPDCKTNHFFVEMGLGCSFGERSFKSLLVKSKPRNAKGKNVFPYLEITIGGHNVESGPHVCDIRWYNLILVIFHVFPVVCIMNTIFLPEGEYPI